MTEALFPSSIDLGERSTAQLGQRKMLTFRGNARNGRHGWLRLTPAYSLHVVSEILDGEPAEQLVLEPFSGTGTTPLVCAQKGFACHAVDINPFLVWLGRLKLQPFTAGEIDTFLESAFRVYHAAKTSENTSAVWVPPIHQIDKWWDTDILKDLAVLFRAIRRQPDIDDRIRDLLKLTFCQVLIGVANVSFGHQSMSFRKQPKKDAALFEQSTSGTFSLFIKTAQTTGESLQEPLAGHNCRIICGDARKLNTVLPLKNYSMVITSPPYPNRMSYIRELRPYMYWLGYLETGRQAGEMDSEAIGGTWGCATSMLTNWKPPDKKNIPYNSFQSLIGRISEKQPVLGNYVHKYFCDIQEHLDSLFQVLRSGARCHYVVGNSKFYDVLLPTQDIYAAMFEEAGFTSVRILTLRKRTSKKELYEYLVEATKP